MAVPMRKQMNRKQKRTLFWGLAVGVSLACAPSCSPSDEARGGGRVEHPVDPSPPEPPPPPYLVPPLASAPVTPAPAVEPPLSNSDIYEQRSGIKLSPLDKTIIDDCPTRAWSKKVPKRRCSNDGECGDGFCDRGRCAAIWSCDADYGQRCEKQNQCGVLPCINGRCRSCTSEAECDWKRGRPGESNVKCRTDVFIAGARECVGSIGSMIGETLRR